MKISILAEYRERRRKRENLPRPIKFVKYHSLYSIHFLSIDFSKYPENAWTTTRIVEQTKRILFQITKLEIAW